MSTAAGIVENVNTMGLRSAEAVLFCKGYQPVRVDALLQAGHTFVYSDGSRVEVCEGGLAFEGAAK